MRAMLSLPRLAVLAACAVVALPATALATRKLHVTGPKTVRIGHEVVFPTTGLKPHERITVNLAPTINRGGNCCGIDVITKARADAHGEAILHWRWPKTYFNGDERIPWRAGTRADIRVLTPSFAHGLKVVRVRR
jgi:hypothetical protein